MIVTNVVHDKTDYHLTKEHQMAGTIDLWKGKTI